MRAWDRSSAEGWQWNAYVRAAAADNTRIGSGLPHRTLYYIPPTHQYANCKQKQDEL